ncbi:hypothetical protein [Spirosoma oryzicola]|uniref:hypothetical protein n=1 Tax=Spirosoma oryzicola TaxID=2898794 RepID=UPI001E4CF285|nr:hypothetical protein [Spirosoma oryzicola]UHG93585.1 hypothetical protein LQ777_11920 [Spirosoma oryzicola]
MGKNYRLLAILCTILLALSVQAQTTQAPTIKWQRLLGPIGNSTLQLAKASHDGCALTYLGQVLRLSESGNTLWQTQIPPTAELPAYSNYAEFITAIPDGGFAVVTRNTYRWSLARLTAEGVVLWVKSFANYENTTSSIYRTFSDLIYTADGGFLAVDYTQYGRNGTATTVYTFDADGNNLVTRQINNDYGNIARGNTTTYKVIQTNDGSYLLVGRATDRSVNFTAWAAKLTPQLGKIWNKNFSSTSLEDVIPNPYTNDSFMAVGRNDPAETRTLLIGPNGEPANGYSQSNRVDNTESFIVAGTDAASYTIVDVVNENGGDLRLQNLTAQGPAWTKKLGGSLAEKIKSVIATNDGGLLVVGTTTSTDGDVQGKTTNDLVPWLVKLGPACTGEVYSVQEGNWNNPATWSCGQIPSNTDVVHLKHRVTIPQSYEAKAQRIIYDLPVQLNWGDRSRLVISQ